MSRNVYVPGAPVAPIDNGPKRLRYPCKANGCPMPGTIFLGATDQPGICGWHYGANGQDFPRITEVLRNWEPVVKVINGARTLSNDPDRCTDVKFQREWMAGAWADLAREFNGSGWKQRVAPKEHEDFGQWAHRLSKFLAGRVRADVFGKDGGDGTGDTPTQAEMRKGLRTFVPHPDDRE